MLHHPARPAAQGRLFAEAARVLLPGGVFAGTDSRPSLRFRLIHLGGTCHPVDPGRLPGRLAAAGFIRITVDAGERLVRSAGRSEEIVGEVLRGRRDQVLLATKVRMPMGPGPNDAGLSRHHIVSGCEASLRRLGTGHIDLYQVHEWDGRTPLEENAHR